MAWSGGLISIMLPTDRVQGDGRNYIVIGEDVPPEIADSYTAAIVAYNGNPDSGMYGFNYWAFGLTTTGRLEISGLMYRDVSSGNGVYDHRRQTILSVQPQSSIDGAPTLVLGTGTYSEVGSNISIPGTTDVAMFDVYQDTASGAYPAGWGIIQPNGGANIDTANGWVVDPVYANPAWSYVIRTEGYYTIEGVVPFTGLVAGEFVTAAIGINGARREGSSGDLKVSPAGQDMSVLTGTKLYYLYPGNYVFLYGYGSAANWRTRISAADGAAAGFSVRKVR
jgi:hypothetical protein